MKHIHGRLGIIHIQTPFRISFFGGGTDFPEYFSAHKGSVLGTTLSRSSYVVLNSLVRLQSKRIKLSYSKLEYANSPEELQHEITKCILKEYNHLWNENFLDIHSFADLPSSSGIGSSSAFTVGLLQALYTLNGQFRTPSQLAQEAIVIEREKLHEKGGWQDQIFAAYGGFNKIDFFDDSFFVTPVSLPSILLHKIEESMIYFFTNIKRSSNGIQQTVFSKENFRDKSRYLKKIHELVSAAENCLYSGKNPDVIVSEFGKLLHESWNAKRSLSEVISGSHLDECYDLAIKAGAFGGKISGAGGGGFFYFIAPPQNHDKIRLALTEKNCTPISARFSKMGSRVIFSEFIS